MVRKIGLALFAAGTVAAGALAIDTPAHAQAGVNAGVLTCNVSSGWGFVFGSSRGLHCVYSPTGEHYTGRINKFGVDIGYTEGGVIVWTVIAPTSNLAPGSLSGHYGGATASATAVVGVGANALIGGSNETITLQPVSLEGNQGLNIAAGIADVTLRPAR
jgi:Protein of unknown function (DUF992)